MLITVDVGTGRLAGYNIELEIRSFICANDAGHVYLQALLRHLRRERKSCMWVKQHITETKQFEFNFKPPGRRLRQRSQSAWQRAVPATLLLAAGIALFSSHFRLNY
jgi:hypothetical protein